jgi:lipopolysaccharide biosynthesis regulator YciM
MPNEMNLLWLLLPVAALSGWLIGQRRINQKDGSSSSSIYPEYFKGLNYVLNEQPDKAIEVFIKMLEVDSETVETHLALGNLFRRRGEVDRAIRIHQNLIARPSLDREQRANALLELGMDYMRSGLLDRAEALFLELIESNLHLNDSCTELLDIYQQEKDWENAIKIARKLEIISGEKSNSIIAQFYCECADSALIDGNMRVAKDSIRQAISIYPKCVRASLIEGKMYQKIGKEKLAILLQKLLSLYMIVTVN